MTTMYLLSLALPCGAAFLVGRWTGERAARRERR